MRRAGKKYCIYFMEIWSGFGYCSRWTVTNMITKFGVLKI
jgi:hypothetical protein